MAALHNASVHLAWLQIKARRCKCTYTEKGGVSHHLLWCRSTVADDVKYLPYVTKHLHHFT